MTMIDKYNQNLDSLLTSFFTVSKFPPVDIYEDANSYTIKADIAGYNQDMINIYIEKHVLYITSTEEESLFEDRKYLIKERRINSFSRSFTLPEDADESNLEAVYKDGILAIKINKMQKVEAKKISIKIN